MIVEVFSKWEGKKINWSASEDERLHIEKRVTLFVIEPSMPAPSHHMFDVPAEVLPADVQVDDRFTVYFEKVKG